MKFILFGCSGNCGKYIAKRLLQDGNKVIGVGRSTTPFSSRNFLYVRGDIRDKNLYSKLPTDIDVVINFAGVQPSILPTSEKTDLERTLEAYLEINIRGVFNILEFVRKNQIKNYVYSTTHRDYEEHWENGVFLDNDMPTKINYNGDHTMYAITKASAMMMGDYFSNSFDIRGFNLRLPMIFLVPDMPYYNVHGKPVLLTFLQIIRSAMRGDDLEIWGDPLLLRDYVYVDNLYNLLHLCLSSNLERGTFNVGTGEAVSTEKFIRTIKQIFDTKNRCKVIYRPEKTTYKCATYNISEQRKKLGYKPILLNEMLDLIRKELESRRLPQVWGWV